jgi:hypothetical protein
MLIAVTACSDQPDGIPIGSGDRRSAGPTSPSATDQLTAAAAATGEPTERPLDALLPTELGGVQLHTFAVGQDNLQRLAARIGMGVGDLEVRYASEHGARFLQTYAIRAPGVAGSELAEAWAGVAYPPEVTDVGQTEQIIGDTEVRVSHAPSAGARLGTFYAFSAGETLLVVQAFDPAVAAEAIAALSR